MNKPSITLGYITLVFTALYAVLKYTVLPGANAVMIIAGILIAIYLPMLFLSQIKAKLKDRPILVDKVGAFLLSSIIITFVFRFNDWSFMGFKGQEVIRIITLPSWIYVIPYIAVSLIYIPWLIYINYRIDKKSLIVNIIGGLGLALIPISLLGLDYNIPYNKSLFQLGNIIFILIYIPLRISRFKKEKKELNYTFQTLIIAYALFILIYGIFKGLPITYLELLNS
jgi:hypothetical protein